MLCKDGAVPGETQFPLLDILKEAEWGLAETQSRRLNVSMRLWGETTFYIFFYCVIQLF